jgi:transcriptional regulator with XRE-family HTH domain
MQQQQHHRNLIGRIGLALREAQLEHDLSEREVARLSGVSRPTVHKLATGGTVRSDLAVRVAGAVMVVDLFSQPAPSGPAIGNGLPQPTLFRQPTLLWLEEVAP